jgi:hypothetical protein
MLVHSAQAFHAGVADPGAAKVELPHFGRALQSRQARVRRRGVPEVEDPEPLDAGQLGQAGVGDAGVAQPQFLHAGKAADVFEPSIGHVRLIQAEPP